MSGLTAAERYRHRLQIAVSLAASLVVTLAWGCMLVFEVGYGTDEVCDPYNEAHDGRNRALLLWCTHRSYEDLLSWCLLFAGAALVAGVAAACTRSRLRWWGVVLATAVACACLWVGFAWPQVQAGA